MTMSIPDFTEAERDLVARLLHRRYGKPVAIELAEADLALDPARAEATACPTLYWGVNRGAQFVVCKVAAGRYRCQFFYTDADHYGTGRDEYDDLERCTVELLRVQADHEKQSAGVSSGRDRGRPCRRRVPGTAFAMTLAKARQLLEVQAGFGGGYDRNGARLILAEVAREHGQEAADALIRPRLTEVFGIAPG